MRQFFLCGVLASCLALMGTTAQANMIKNGGFESPLYTSAVWPHYMNSIPEWTFEGSNGGGVNSSAGPFYDNGSNPEGDQVLFLQQNKLAKQNVSLVAGKTYHLSLYYNARIGGKPGMKVTLGSAELPGSPVSEISPMTGPFRRFETDFVATATGTVEFTISQIATEGDNTLLVDNVVLDEKGGPAVGSVNPTSITLTSTIGFLATQPIALTNAGGTTLTVTKLTLQGATANQFTTATATPVKVPPFGGKANIVVGFKPTAGGYVTGASLKIETDQSSGTSTFEVKLNGVGYDGPQLVNGSFETPNAGGSNYGSGLVIPGWTKSGAIGVGSRNIANSNAFVNNGAHPDGNQVLWTQGPASVTQSVPGFRVGERYRVSLYANARAIADNKALLWVSLGGKDLFGTTDKGIEITAVGEENAYVFFSETIVADAPVMLLKIAQPAPPDDSSLLVDNVRIELVPNAVANWTVFE